MTVPILRTFTEDARTLLRGFNLDDLENSPHLGYLVNSELKLIYANKQHQLIAEKNGAPDLIQKFGYGSLILNAISGPQKDYFETVFRTALTSPQPVTIDYECPTPDTYRDFRMIIYPLADKRGLYFEHSLLLERSHDRQAVPFSKTDYLDEHNIAHQCGHCRRTRNLKTDSYNWVPDAFEIRQVSHGLCPTCLSYHYPDY